MTPVRFGDSPRALFGLHLPPAGETDRRHAVLLCNPFGQEAIRCHRMMRVLAERLARAGFHAMRFDYFGTGDSDGGDDEGDLEAWTDDVLRAADDLARRSGCERMSWFGLRLGATLAVMASARAATPPARLVLWDPVLEGAPYLDELARLHATEMANEADLIEPPARAAAADGGEALGYPLGPRLAGQLGAIAPVNFASARADQVSLLYSPAATGVEALRAVLGAASIRLRARTLQTQVVWASDEAMNTSIVPAEALAAIVAMIEEGA